MWRTWLTVIALTGGGARARVDPDHLRCLVCRSTVDEFEAAVARIDPRKTVEVGNYRLDAGGDMHQERVPLARSQVHLSEMLDDVCEKLDDYVRVRYKATGKLAVMKMLTDSGSMNPDFSLVEFVTDDDLNKSLKFYCEGIVGENEDALVDLYASATPDEPVDGKTRFCRGRLGLCPEWMLPDADDLDWTPDKEKARGPDPYGFGGLDPSKEEL